MGETPVPIPNTMVKTQAADGTVLETIWESRWLPDQKKETLKKDKIKKPGLPAIHEDKEACNHG